MTEISDALISTTAATSLVGALITYACRPIFSEKYASAKHATPPLAARDEAARHYRRPAFDDELRDISRRLPID